MNRVLALQKLVSVSQTSSPDQEWSTWSNCCNGSTTSASNCCNET
jgi:hypothetical protein